MAERKWYKLGKGCEYDGLVAGTTIRGVREAQMKVLKQGFVLPDGTLLAGAPPILPEEWFGFGEEAEDIRDLYVNKEVIVSYIPSDAELDYAYEHMFPALKPKASPTKSRSKKIKDDESASEADEPIENSEVDDGE